MSDVVEVSLCPICGEALNVNAPDTVDYNGQLVHADCVESEPSPNNNSYT